MNDASQSFARNKAQQNAFEHDSIDLNHLVDSLWVNRYLIALSVAVFLALSIFYLILTPPIYSADVLFKINAKEGMTDTNRFAMLGIDGGGSKEETEISLIRSRFILGNVIESMGLDLTIKPNYFPIFGAFYARHHNKQLATPFLGLSHFAWGGEKLTIKQFTLPDEELGEKFLLVALPQKHFAFYENGRRLLTAKVGAPTIGKSVNGNNFVLEVSELVANPDTAFDVSKKPIVDILDGLKSQLMLSDLGQENGLMERTGILQLKTLGKDPQFIVLLLNNIAKAVVQESEMEKSREIAKMMDFLNKELPEVKQSLTDSENALNNYLAQHGMIDLSTESRLLTTELIEVEKQLSLLQLNNATLNEKYTPQHPFVLAAKQREQVLMQERNKLQQQVSQLPMHDQVIVNLTRDVRVKGQLYLFLYNKLQALQVSKASSVGDISVLSWAEAPQKPFPIKSWLILLGGCAFGFVFGIFAVSIRNLLHRKISDLNVFEKDFGLINLAIVPYSDKQHNMLLHSEFNKTLPLLAANDPRDLSIEALRSLRTSLQFAMLDAKNNVLSITGISPGVGKSFISVNFAYLLAQAGKKVLLIDGDLRKGHLRKHFNVSENVKGLTEVICGSCTFNEAVMHGVATAHLDFLATGIYPPNPSELLMNPRFSELLKQVSGNYDIVMIDTAPILAVTDAAIICQQVGTSFVVVAADHHEHIEVELAMNRFAANHITISGMVFNFVKKDKGLYRRFTPHKYKKYQYEYGSKN